MKFGLLLHADRGIDAVFEEARQADRQGFDSIWLFDHLMDWNGKHVAEGPLDSLTLMIALGAITSRVRLAWAMLNLSFRNPAVLAKMLATLDHITHGRVICSVGAGWFKEEYEAYDIPLVDDHDERLAFARDAIQLMKELWTHPGPERVTFERKHVRVRNIPFNPAPFQKPHPPIWFGGDSDESLATVKTLADGWVMLRSGTKPRLAEIMGAPDWPKRPMAVAKSARIYVRPSRDAAITDAKQIFDLGGRMLPPTFEEYLAQQVVGTPDECVRQIKEIGSWGVNYLRLDCIDAAHQERLAKLILPAFAARL